MLPDLINVSHRNLANDADISSSYSRFRNRERASEFHEASHTDTNAEKLNFSVIDPKPNGTFLGQRKASIKVTSTATVLDAEGNDIQRNNILELKTSFAIGTTPEEKHNLIQRLFAVSLQADVYDKAIDRGHY